MEARKQDTEVLAITNEISGILAALVARARQMKLAIGEASQRLMARDYYQVNQMHNQLSLLLDRQLADLQTLASKDAELIEVEQQDVKQHEEEAHRLAIRDKELQGKYHWRPSDAH